MIIKRLGFALLICSTSATLLTAVAPGPPQNLAATVSGSTVTFTWQPPSSVGGVPSGYLIEASLSPAGAIIASLPVSVAPFTVANVPNGVYYVRVLAVNSNGASTPSNEIVVSIPNGAAVCTTPPNTPSNLTASALGTLVSIAWVPSPSGCPATGYVVQAGSAPNQSNIAVVNVGAATSLSASAPGGTYYIRVVAVNGSGNSSPSPDLMLTVGSLSPSTPLPGSPTGTSFGPGQWFVNTQIAPGRYYSDPRSGCYWERQRGLTGSVNDVIANEFIGFDARQLIVDIASTDLAFETDGDCGIWFSTPRHGFQGNVIPPGVWLVGAQITPGTYAVGAGSGCYWERLRGFSGSVADIIDNEFVSGAGQQLISILSTDVGFNNDADCGTWTRINDLRIVSDREASDPSQVELNWRAHKQHEARKRYVP
jgi:hypothetical protein